MLPSWREGQRAYKGGDEAALLVGSQHHTADDSDLVAGYGQDLEVREGHESGEVRGGGDQVVRLDAKTQRRGGDVPSSVLAVDGRGDDDYRHGGVCVGVEGLGIRVEYGVVGRRELVVAEVGWWWCCGGLEGSEACPPIHYLPPLY